ncbi:pectinesterase inhibitor 3 [Humulus lupulus]|uniref:pectinesterase inhibitor 3 n=1 Tax=Humulus lupulus TaxID=3486 RepID=UPI002B405056|nr:pectinesterase inhibitor 3 [Humulus lupulus]
MSPLSLILFILVLLSPSYSVSGKKRSHHDSPTPASDLVRTSCVHANYPNLCLRTLSTYSGPARTPRDLAQAAVNVSLARASRISKFLTRTARGSFGSKRQRAALGDCVEQISDSVEDLSKTLSELQHLRWETFRWQMSNAQTWVSAALTNEDTCLEGFKELQVKMKTDVKRKITNVARVTSNALYMINRLDETRGS